MAECKSETQLPDQQETEIDGLVQKMNDRSSITKSSDIRYRIDEIPPWYLTIFLGFQHYLIMFISCASVPLIFASALCLPVDSTDLSNIINTLMFVSGITTILQTTIGSRLPIVQGSSFAYLIPLLAMMSQPQWKCPPQLTHNISVALHANNNTELPFEYPREIEDTSWKLRMREIQGAVIVASLFQVLSGATGLMQGILRCIGPLTIAPTITIIGLGLFSKAADMCSLQWPVAILTVVLVTVLSQYLGKVLVPCGRMPKNESQPEARYPIFSMYSFVIAILTTWLLCFVLTISGALGQNEPEIGYHARTDIKLVAMKNTAWFRIPYPGQWGTPSFSVSGTIGMMVGVMASMIESIGDYYACARVSGAPPPPSHAVNRGLLAEGLGGILSGAMGTGVGSTSFSQNIAAISITRVGSLRVVQVSGLIMIIMSLFGKIAAVLITIPTPILGGLFLVMFGMVTAVGLSNLHYVDLSSSRNLYILGLSILTGLSVPHSVNENMEYIRTGVDALDQTIAVLLTTGMFLAGFVAFVLDNTVPGTLEERGIVGMRAEMMDSDGRSSRCSIHCYDVPYASKFTRRFPWTRRLPICQHYDTICCCQSPCGGKNMATPTTEENHVTISSDV